MGGGGVGRLVTGVGRLGRTFVSSTTLRVRGNGGTTKAHTHGTSLRLRGLVGRFEGTSLRTSGWSFVHLLGVFVDRPSK